MSDPAVRYYCPGKMNTWDLLWKYQRGMVVNTALSLFCTAFAREGKAKAGGPRLRCPEFPMPLSPGTSMPSIISTLTGSWCIPILPTTSGHVIHNPGITPDGACLLFFGL